MANVRNLPKSSAPFLSPEDPDRGDVPADTDPHYFPATKNFFCPALLGKGLPGGEPYKLLQNDYEIQKVSPSHRRFWDDEKHNANRLRTRRTAAIENQREADYNATYENKQFGPDSVQLGDLHQSWAPYYHQNNTESCGPYDEKDPNTFSEAHEVDYSKIPKCKKLSGIETNFSNLKRMKNCYYERKKEEDRLKRKCELNVELDTYCSNKPNCPRGCHRAAGVCRSNLAQWQTREKCSIEDNDWPDCCQTYFDTTNLIRFQKQNHKPPFDALEIEMDECEKYIREAVNADYENEKKNLELLNLFIIPYPGQHENYLFKYIRKCGERKNLLSHIEFTKKILKKLAKKYGIVIDETDGKTSLTNLRNRISKKLWDSDEYMSKVYDELEHVCNLPLLPLIEIDDILISNHRDIDQLWDKWEKNQRKLKRYMSQVEKQFALFKILEKIEKPKIRENFFDIDITTKPTKFKIKEEVWKEFLKKFDPDIIVDSREDTDFVLWRMGQQHLPEQLFDKRYTVKRFKKLKTEIETKTINNIVDKIKEKLFPKATILEEKEKEPVDLWDLWNKLDDNLKEKIKFIRRKIGKTLDPPTRGVRYAGINNILKAFIDQRPILGQPEIPTARNVEQTLLRHSYFENNPTKIHLRLNLRKATQMRNLLKEMPFKGLLECYNNKIRKNEYVDAIWEFPEGTVNRRQNPQ